MAGKRSKFNLRKKLHFFSARSPSSRVRPSLYNITNRESELIENITKNNSSHHHTTTLGSLVVGSSDDDDEENDDCGADNSDEAQANKSIKRSQSFDSYIKKLRTLSRASCNHDYENEHAITGGGGSDSEHSDNKTDNDSTLTVIKTDLNSNLEIPDSPDCVIDSTIYEVDENFIEHETQNIPQQSKNVVLHSFGETVPGEEFELPTNHTILPQIDDDHTIIDECQNNPPQDDGSQLNLNVVDKHSNNQDTQTFVSVQSMDQNHDDDDDQIDCPQTQPVNNNNNSDTVQLLTEREKIEKIKLERRNQIRENYVQKVKSGVIKRSPSRIPVPKSRSENVATTSNCVSPTHQVSSPVKMRVKKASQASPTHRNSDIFTAERSSPIDEKRRSVPNFAEGYISPYAYRNRQGSFKRPNAPQKDGPAGPESPKKTQVSVTPLRTAINKRQKMVEIDNISKIFENKS